MGSLTNVGEFVCLYKGLGGDSAATNTAFALSYGTRNNAGIFVHLARLNVPSDGPERRDNWFIPAASVQLGYNQQLALFAQPDYETNDLTTCSAINTNAMTFGPALNDWGTFTHLVLVIPASTPQDVIAYFELAQPVTISEGESYLVAANSLRLTFQQNVTNTTFNVVTKRILLDQLLGIQDQAAADRAGLQGLFPSSQDSNSTAVLITVTDTPPGESALQNLETATVEVAAAQPIIFTFTDFDTSDEINTSPTEEIRVQNRDRITFTFPPDQANSSPRTVTHFLILNTSLYILAAVPLASPTTFGPLNNLTIAPRQFSMAFR